MKKVGFIDYYLNEEHAHVYASEIEKQSHGEYKVAYAYAKIEPPFAGGMSSAEWAELFNVQLLTSITELVEKSDCIVVLAPDNCEMHYELAKDALASGKPVFVDKTFAESGALARKFFAIAEEHKTPCFSTSSIRYSSVMDAIDPVGICSITSFGEGDPHYIVHQLEPLFMLMGTQVEKVLCTTTEGNHSFTLLYSDGRYAYCNHAENVPHHTEIQYADHSETVTFNDNFYARFVTALLHFFETKEVPVAQEVTIRIMDVQERCIQARETPGVWLDIN